MDQFSNRLQHGSCFWVFLILRRKDRILRVVGDVHGSNQSSNAASSGDDDDDDDDAL